MSNTIIDITGRILGLLFFLALAYIEPKLARFLEAKLGKERGEALAEAVRVYVAAAEQMYKEAGSGERRKAYVIAELEAIGYRLTDELDAQIEAAVYHLKAGAAND